MFKNIFIILLISSALLLSGCAKYNPKPLLPIKNSPNLLIKDNIEFDYKILSDKEIKEIFCNKNLAKKYKAIQVCIENNSDNAIILDSKNINTSIENKKTIRKKTNYNTFLRASSSGIVSTLLSIPSSFFLSLYVVYSIDPKIHPFFFLYGYFTTAPYIIILISSASTLFTTYKFRKTNKNINIDYDNKIFGLGDCETVYPEQTLNKVLFFKKENLEEDVIIKFVDEDLTKEIEFEIQV